jgi:hypothetical protein
VLLLKSNIFKLLAHLNNGMKESSNINPCLHKEIFLYYYKFLWTNISLQENYCNTENVDDEIIITNELREALNNKKRRKIWRRKLKIWT